MIGYQAARREHIPQILKLQEANLLSKLPPERQGNGFVTTAITPQQYEQLIEQGDLFMAVEGEELRGYVVSSSWQFLSQWPIFAHMVTLFDQFTFDGERMTVDNSYQYGPICVDENHRGRGIVQGLYEFARKSMAARYPYGLTFINKRNPRSFVAHTRKLPLNVLIEFGFNGNEYYFLGFKTRD